MINNIKVVWIAVSKFNALTQAQKDDLCTLWVVYPDSKPTPVTGQGGAAQ